MGLGRHHPVVRKALHDVLDASLADLTRFDCQPLPGLLAEKLLAARPAPGPGVLRQQRYRGGGDRAEVRPVRHRQAEGPVLRPRLPRADHRLAVGQRRGRLPRRLRTRCCPTPRSRSATCDALERELQQGRRGRAIVEPIQGKGVHEAPPGFLRGGPGTAAPAQGAAHRRRGADRASAAPATSTPTSTRTASNPTWSCVAKALSGGYVPVGATLGKDWIFKKVYSSMDRVLVHSASFGSNAQAMAAGLAVLVGDGGRAVVANARRTGELLQ